MRAFATLFDALDTTTATTAKVEALASYFARAPAADAAWATFVLIGRKPKRCVGPALLRRWLAEEAGLPAWLVEETYASVGDLAETIALLLGDTALEFTKDSVEASLSEWFEQRLLGLQQLEETEKRTVVVRWWQELAYRENFLVNKLLTGALRVGVSRSLVTRALAQLFGRERSEIERALIGNWTPTAEFWQALVRGDASSDVSQPYPFYLASPLEGDVAELGQRDAWLAEWKWDGIRGQIVRRGGSCALWSRGEEIITERFPEIVVAAMGLPEGTVLDGEVVLWSDQQVLPFASLQKRIGRRSLSAKLLQELPARFLAYDLLEFAGVDWRSRTLRERRAQLQLLLLAAASALQVSAAIEASSWQALAMLRDESRARGVEGLMLKAWQSSYGNGRQRGAWWKWKVAPFTFDAVMLYAAPGHGRRSNLYTDYTFAVWDGAVLVPVAKAYSGLTDVEIRELDRWIRAHTREKFGPVRSVEPVQVFELAFEGIALSSRHKSGIAVRFPRILSWRHDKPAAEADTLQSLRDLLANEMRDVL